jgi:hypothetical protein
MPTTNDEYCRQRRHTKEENRRMYDVETPAKDLSGADRPEHSQEGELQRESDQDDNRNRK